MYSFKKEERLCNKKLIDGLFHNGSSFLCYPLKISWLPVTVNPAIPVQVVFAVGKKRYKRATDRNQIKRRIREAYRLQKQQLLYNHLITAQRSIALSIGFIGKELGDYSLIEKKMIKALQQVCSQALSA
jgi:ribonuclease P protein component